MFSGRQNANQFNRFSKGGTVKITQRFLIFVALLAQLGLNISSGLTQNEITVDWIYSDDSAALVDVPEFTWLADNTAILLDPRKPESERTFEKFEPASGKRLPVMDMNAAVASLKSLMGKEDSTFVLAWPDAFDATGKQALYVLAGEIYLLNVEAARFQRITRTEAVEKAVNFSPDGKNLAFVRANDLYIYDIAAGTEKRLTSDGTETTLNGTLSWVYWEEVFGRRDIGYWWSPDSKSIAYLQTDESPVGVVHYVDFKPQYPRVITQRYPKAGTPNPVVRLGVMKVDDASTTWIDLPEYEYLVRVIWRPDNAGFAVQTMNREQTEIDLYMTEAASGKSQHILKETDPGWVNINDDFYFLKDGKHFIWQSERDGYAHLYRFTLDGKLVNQITKGDWALRSSGGVFWLRQSVSAIDEENGWIYFTALKKSSIERHLYRIRFDGSELQQLTKSDGTHRITFSPNAKYYFSNFSNIITPPTLALYESSGKLKMEVAESRKDLAAKLNIQPVELFTIPTRDGFPMPAEILKPRDFDPNKKYPIIYHIYAGPSAPTVFNAWQTVRYFDQMLMRNGYLVVRFDHRSATAISKKLENRLAGMMSGPTELEDIVDGVKWLKAQSYVDPDRFGIWGWSGGGSFTLNAMTNSEEFKAGISVAPVTDWHYYDTKWAEFGMKLPEGNAAAYRRTSFVQTAKNLHGRLLLVHGTYDDNVHPQNSWAFIEELIQNRIQFEMMFYPMRKHGIADRPARRHLYTKMLEFWQREL